MTHFGEMSVVFEASERQITARLDGPRRNPPEVIRLRFRPPGERTVADVRVNGNEWETFEDGWVFLPGDIGRARVVARLGDPTPGHTPCAYGGT